jgi:hypothetical protein
MKVSTAWRTGFNVPKKGTFLFAIACRLDLMPAGSALWWTRTVWVVAPVHTSLQSSRHWILYGHYARQSVVWGSATQTMSQHTDLSRESRRHWILCRHPARQSVFGGSATQNMCRDTLTCSQKVEDTEFCTDICPTIPSRRQRYLNCVSRHTDLSPETRRHRILHRHYDRQSVLWGSATQAMCRDTLTCREKVEDTEFCADIMPDNPFCAAALLKLCVATHWLVARN